MDTDQRLDALVAPLRADVVSGASVVGVRVWNRYFESFELERVTVVVTESEAVPTVVEGS